MGPISRAEKRQYQSTKLTFLKGLDVNKIKLIVLVAMLSTPVFAGMVDNTKMVNLYKTQLEPTKELMAEVNEVLLVSEPILDMYKKLGKLTPEYIALNGHFHQLEKRSIEIYGEPLTPTPFKACSQIPVYASLYWEEKKKNSSSDNSTQLTNAMKTLNHNSEICSDELKNPPPKKTEELGIIDVTE